MQDNLLQTVFGPGGLVARAHENYEYRDGQVKMSEAITRAFEQKKHLIVEAGTGTGKTLAYLIPAIAYALQSKKRVVISTGTKNLQEQLMEKDIPFLQKILPKKFTVGSTGLTIGSHRTIDPLRPVLWCWPCVIL
jgi:ATP-dependent DNA helicase DinG